MASSTTEAESQDLAEWFSRVHPELRFMGQASPYKSRASSHKSSKSAKDDAIRNGTITINDTPPTCQNSKGLDGGSRKVVEESQGGMGESGSIFSQPGQDPLGAFLDMLEGASSMPWGSPVVYVNDD